MMASSARRGWLVVAVAVAAVMATATTAGAHGVSPSIGVPAAPPPEDSAFGIALSGDVSGLRFGDAYLYVKVRRAGGTPCAPVQRSDPGESVVRFEDVSDVFTTPRATRLRSRASTSSARGSRKPSAVTRARPPAPA